MQHNFKLKLRVSYLLEVCCGAEKLNAACKGEEKEETLDKKDSQRCSLVLSH